MSRVEQFINKSFELNLLQDNLTFIDDYGVMIARVDDCGGMRFWESNISSHNVHDLYLWLKSNYDFE